MGASAGRGGKNMPYATTPVSNSSVQVAFRKALQRAGINKKATVHTLRHHADSRIMPTPRIESGALLTPLQFKSA